MVGFLIKNKMEKPKQSITCLIGDPVEHSVSDAMFKSFASLTKLENYTHLKLRVPKNKPSNLRVSMQAMRLFNFAGANITLPYKEKAIKYLDKINKDVSSMGAVNTIVNKKGDLIGYNTDGYGAIKAIETKLRPIKKNDNVLVFGSGGAARAIINKLPKVFSIVLLGRRQDSKQAKKFKKDFAKNNIEIKTRFITDKNIILSLQEADIIINATPVGMFPKGDNSIVCEDHFNKIDKSLVREKCFFDAVFNPFETQFLKLAKRSGAKTCSGIYMMIYQGIRAFYLWTGKKFPKKNVEKTSKMLQRIIKSNYD